MSAPRELPILFTGPNVRAIYDDLKGQTRRVMRPQPEHIFGDECPPSWGSGRTKRGWLNGPPDRWHSDWLESCPYGQPGDLLYVRETWRPWSWHEGEPICVEFRADGVTKEVDGDGGWDTEQWEDWLWQRISKELKDEPTDEMGNYGPWEGSDDNPLKWRPSIFMPKAAARLWLRVTDVRVERVQDISEEDVRAEGFAESKEECSDMDGVKIGDFTIVGSTEWHSASGNFALTWEDINEKRGYGWETNPWVWAITFERVGR